MNKDEEWLPAEREKETKELNFYVHMPSGG